jgi:hypothetical protein
MDAVKSKNCRVILTSLFDALDRNCKVFELLFNNYESLIKMILEGVGKLIDDSIRGEDLKVKKEYMLRCWLRYWLGLRDEYTLAYYGCIVAAYQKEGREGRLSLFDENYKRTGVDKIKLNQKYDCVYCSCIGFKVFTHEISVNLNVCFVPLFSNSLLFRRN